MLKGVFKRKGTLVTTTLPDTSVEVVLALSATKDNWVGNHRRGFEQSFIIRLMFLNRNFESRKGHLMYFLLHYITKKTIQNRHHHCRKVLDDDPRIFDQIAE